MFSFLDFPLVMAAKRLQEFKPSEKTSDELEYIHPWITLASLDLNKVYNAIKQNKMGTNQSASLPEKTTGLTFNEAMKAMHSGFKVRLPEWTGYWFVNNGEMCLMTRTGDILNAPDFKKFGTRDDWEIAIQGLGFDFATLALKAGKLLTRQSWTNQMIFIRPSHTMTVGYALTADRSLPTNLRSWLKVKANDTKEALGQGADDANLAPIKLGAYLCLIDNLRNITNGWTPSQDDLTATDWEVIQVPEWTETAHPDLSSIKVKIEEVV